MPGVFYSEVFSEIQRPSSSIRRPSLQSSAVSFRTIMDLFGHGSCRWMFLLENSCNSLQQWTSMTDGLGPIKTTLGADWQRFQHGKTFLNLKACKTQNQNRPVLNLVSYLKILYTALPN